MDFIFSSRILILSTIFCSSIFCSSKTNFIASDIGSGSFACSSLVTSSELCPRLILAYQLKHSGAIIQNNKELLQKIDVFIG
jgi:hypothetical protein